MLVAATQGNKAHDNIDVSLAKIECISEAKFSALSARDHEPKQHPQGFCQGVDYWLNSFSLANRFKNSIKVTFFSIFSRALSRYAL